MDFEFGKNWKRFLKFIDDARIKEAEDSLLRMLDLKTLSEKSFLDVGSGSGLFSLAAVRPGAKVYSFDIDENCIECNKYLKNKYSDVNSEWTINQGSALDKNFLSKLVTFDIVYSWGVLHHTGNMWKAIDNLISLVKKKGYFILSF